MPQCHVTHHNSGSVPIKGPLNFSAIANHIPIGSRLDLAFDTLALRQLCESEAKAKRQLGVHVAAHLKRRLADLRAAGTIMDLIASPPFILGTPEIMAMELAEGYRIVFMANHTEPPTLDSGQLDWSSVTRVKVLEVAQS